MTMLNSYVKLPKGTKLLLTMSYHVILVHLKIECPTQVHGSESSQFHFYELQFWIIIVYCHTHPNAMFLLMYIYIYCLIV